MKSKIVNHGKKDDAVSPVIGVMLMIVVTVVIAAVVALFAGNVVTSTEAAPVVVMEMDAYSTGSVDANSKLVMSTRGGDPLELAKLKVVVSDSTGNYDLSFAGLDQRGLGDHLEIGEKLTVFTLENIGTVASSASGGDISEVATQMKSDFKVGNKIHVMVTFNENAVIFEKDIVVKAGVTKSAGGVDASIYLNSNEFYADWGTGGTMKIYVNDTPVYTFTKGDPLEPTEIEFPKIGTINLKENDKVKVTIDTVGTSGGEPLKEANYIMMTLYNALYEIPSYHEFEEVTGKDYDQYLEFTVAKEDLENIILEGKDYGCGYLFSLPGS